MPGLSRGHLASLILAFGVLFMPEPARACSCADLSQTTLERCRTARRVFAGTVDSYDWPLAYRAEADSSVEIHLAVDTVWRGAVPARLVVEKGPLGGPGSCTIYPPPGQRFVVCDNEDDDAAPAIGVCRRPALGEYADELMAALGPGAEPTAPAVSPFPWWTDRAKIADSMKGVVLLVAPFAAAMLGAGAGALMRRWRPKPEQRMSVRRFLGLLIAVAIVVVVTRLVLHMSLPKDYRLFKCVTLGPAVLAGALGLVLAYGQQRRGWRGLRGLAIAFAGVGVALAAGFARLHLPVQPADVVACSEARARDHLRARPAFPTRDEWVRRAPAACTDFGLSRLRVHERASAVVFADGRGGEYWVRANPAESTEYGWELP